jgi:hypothetical protein
MSVMRLFRKALRYSVIAPKTMIVMRSRLSPITWSFERGSEDVFRKFAEAGLSSTANIPGFRGL